MDKFKQILTVLLLVIGIAGYYLLAEQIQLVRVGAVIVATALAAAVGLQTRVGQQFWGFLKNARVEVRKVVWPSRKETTQMTLVVILMVVAVGSMLWVFDLILGYSVSQLIRGGS